MKMKNVPKSYFLYKMIKNTPAWDPTARGRGGPCGIPRSAYRASGLWHTAFRALASGSLGPDSVGKPSKSIAERLCPFKTGGLLAATAGRGAAWRTAGWLLDGGVAGWLVAGRRLTGCRPVGVCLPACPPAATWLGAGGYCLAGKC